MSADIIDVGALSDLARVVGWAVTTAASVSAVWLVPPPAVIRRHRHFEQAKKLASVAVAIYFLEIWFFMANTEGSRVLAIVAGPLCLTGLAVFFWTVSASHSKPAPTPARLNRLLLGYVAYTVLISGALVSIVEALLIVGMNPFTTKAAEDPKRVEKLLLTLSVKGTTSARVNEDVPFKASSGQLNFGCGNQAQAQVRYQLPLDAQLLGAPSASWENSANIASSSVGAVIQQGNELLATGSVTGLQPVSVLGLQNCPGGGHGELVLSGQYRVSRAQERPDQRDIRNELTFLKKEPISVSLPTAAEMTVQRIELLVTKWGDGPEGFHTAVLTPAQSQVDLPDVGLVARLLQEPPRVQLQPR